MTPMAYQISQKLGELLCIILMSLTELDDKQTKTSMKFGNRALSKEQHSFRTLNMKFHLYFSQNQLWISNYFHSVYPYAATTLLEISSICLLYITTVHEMFLLMEQLHLTRQK
jgi:hypothetical protein